MPSPAAPASTALLRRGFGGGLLVVMSMGMAVMVVLAMLVVLMVVVIMAMIIMMSMTMRRMGVAAGFRVGMRMGLDMGVRMGFRMRVESLGIGAAFGIERRLDLDHARAEPLHHRLDDMIAPDAQAFRHDLGRQMAVAEMPGDPDQMMRVGAPDLEQRLGG